MNIQKNWSDQASFNVKKHFLKIFFLLFLLLISGIYMFGCGQGLIDDSQVAQFNGMVSATTSSETEVILSWNAATDETTSVSSMKYLVFQGTSTDALYANITSKTFFKIVTGITSTTATGLTANTTYYFAVRSSDEAGNIDSNSITKVATTYAIVSSIFRLVPSGTTNDLYGISFYNTGGLSGYGWASGKAGTILRSTNSGETWAAQASSTTKDLYIVAAIATQTAIAMGEDRVLTEFVDGAWSATTAFNFDVRSFAFNGGAKFDFALGTDGGLRKSLHDQSLSSKTFEAISTSPYTGIRACDFYDDAHGVIVGENGFVAMTSNTGESWTQLTNIPTTKNINGVFYKRYPPTTYFLISGDRGFLAKSTDNGGTWTTLSSNLPVDFYTASPVGLSEFIISGTGGRIYKVEY